MAKFFVILTIGYLLGFPSADLGSHEMERSGKFKSAGKAGARYFNIPQLQITFARCGKCKSAGKAGARYFNIPRLQM